MMSGTSKKRRYIPVDAVYNSLPSGLSTTLLPFHALTGCDTTSYFANHTKRSTWKVFEEHHKLLNNLGIGELTDDTIKCAEAFVCRIYNVHRTDSVDSARHLLFSKTGKPETMSPTSEDPVKMGWKRNDNGLEPVLMSHNP